MGIGETKDAGPKDMPRNTAQEDVTADNTGGDIPDELKEPVADSEKMDETEDANVLGN